MALYPPVSSRAPNPIGLPVEEAAYKVDLLAIGAGSVVATFCYVLWP